MNRANRLPLAIVSGAVFVVAALLLLIRPIEGFPPNSWRNLFAVGAGGLALYLGSHLLRAVRLAVIGVTVHKTSFRTLALLNLSLAPWSMIAPFKVDELIRLNELRSINKSLARALITVIIDRSMDGPVLLAFAIFLWSRGEVGIALVMGFYGAALATLTIGFFAASQILQLVQRYIFLYHYKPRALQLLKIVHHLRNLALLGRETILNAAPILILCTLGIWFLEIAAVGLLLWMMSPTSIDIQSVISTTLLRAKSGWRELLLGEQLDFPAAVITRIFMVGLLLIWPMAIWLYCKRRLLEVREAHFLHRQQGVSGLGRRA
jgi:hypothetical protein